jgi:hypothetical protein
VVPLFARLTTRRQSLFYVFSKTAQDVFDLTHDVVLRTDSRQCTSARGAAPAAQTSFMREAIGKLMAAFGARA